MKFFLLLLAVGLLGYTNFRAYALSMTHDESVSYLWFCGIDIWSCFGNQECWPSANNHLLNTYLFQLTTGWLGVSEWTIRLPNLLAHVLYLVASLLLVVRSNQQWWLVLLGFLALNANTFLLDFFSLSRGYGLCAGLVMGSIFSYIQYLRKGKYSFQLAAYVLAFGGVMANFTALNYWVSLWASACFMDMISNRGQGKRFGFLVRQNLFPLLSSLLIAVLLYRPIRFLGAGGEFGYGAPSLLATFQSIVSCSLYEAGYFGGDTVVVFTTLYVGVLLAALTGAFVAAREDFGETWRLEYLFAALLFVMMCLVMLGQHWLLGSDFLLDRKALLFVPVSGLLLFYGMRMLSRYRWSRFVGMALIFMGGWHFFRTANLSYSFEWKYDKDTRDMVLLLEHSTPPGTEKFRLGLNWQFQPTAVFYQQYYNLQSFLPPPFLSEIEGDGNYRYYYLYEPELPKLKGRYTLVRDFGGGKLLLKRSGPN